jgi:hypothetical protein
MPTTLRNGDILFNDSTTQSTAASSAGGVNVQQFDSTATWTKPTGRSMARIQVWGGGGGGSRSNANVAGGGGGAYNELIVPLSFLGASITITVGAAGAGRTGSTGVGTAGGNSSVPLATSVNGRSAVEAFGGGGGNTNGQSGAGGGQLSAGSLSVVGSPIIRTGADQAAVLTDLGGFGGGLPAGNIFGGGAGAVPGTSPGSAMYGGGGGGATGVAAGFGLSVWGGNGGVNSVGAAPGGGGGCPAVNVNGWNGGAGRVIITVW